MYFPKQFRNSDEQNFNILFRNRLSAELDSVLFPETDQTQQIFDIEKQMLEMRKPNVWNVYVEGNMEISMEVDFEKFLLAVSEHTNEKVDELSVFRFYALIGFLEEKFKPNRSK